MASRIRERFGAIESSLSVFAQNWRNRIRSQHSGHDSNPSTPVSTTTNLDTLTEVTIDRENDNIPASPTEPTSPTAAADGPTILQEQETSTQESLNNVCQTNSNNLSSRHTHPSSSSSSRRSRRSNRSSRHGSYRIGIQDIDDDRNMLAAIISLFVILILASALAQFRWFSLFNESSLCDFGVHFRSEDDFKLLNVDNNSSDESSFDSDKYIHQPYSNSLYSTPQPPQQKPPGNSVNGKSQGVSSAQGETNTLCDNPEIASMKRSIIILCFIAIKFTLMQLFLDILGTRGYYSKRVFSVLRSHGVGNIITVIVCVLIIAICYYMGLLTERLQMDYVMKKFRNYATLMSKSSSINGRPHLTYHSIPFRQVKFEVSYYLVTLAGFFSILAAAANLFRKPKYVLMERIGGHTRTRRIGGGDQATLLNLDSSNFFPYFQPGVGWVGYPQTAAAIPSAGGHSIATTRNDVYSGYARPDPFGCPPPPPYTP